MPLIKEQGIYKTFTISITLTVALCLSGIFLGMTIRTRDLINDELLEYARAHFNIVVMARKWNAGYGGVYVEKKNGVESNPYIKNPDIITKDGRVFTLRNPAIMTREISELSGKDSLFSYHITSLKPVNPGNKPDASEIKALESFERGAKEAFWEEDIKGIPHMRYIAPLYVEKPCLACHASQGYKEGEVRGGINVNIPIGSIKKKLSQNFIQIMVFGVTTSVLLLSLLWYFTRRLIRQVAIARKQIEILATTDSLTGVSNRRNLLERFEGEFIRARRRGNAMCIILFDIDHFKRVNDTHGHLSGDEVLKETSQRVAGLLRPYDCIGRYGGEEFVVLLPETSETDAASIAERIRTAVSDTPFLGENGIKVTISSGITCLMESDMSIGDLLRRADGAMYEAKAAGRNITVCANTNPAKDGPMP